MSVLSARAPLAVLLQNVAGRKCGARFAVVAFLAAAFFSVWMPAKSVAAEQPAIALELNAAKSTADACRMSFLFRNDLSAEIGDLALEVVFFNSDGLVEQFFMLKSGRLPRGKSRVRQFDMPQISCDGISRILVNDVAACEGDALTPQSCLDALSVSSRSKISFGL